MLQSLIKVGIVVVISCLWSALASAGAVTCQPSNERVATLDDAMLCVTRNGPGANINSGAELDTLIDDLGDPWVKEGEVKSNQNTNDLLSIVFDQGYSWGNSDIKATWYIDASFWTMYSRGVITMHVGEGQGNPDAFAWELTSGETSDRLVYEDLDGRGGGISNLFLFGSGTPSIVVEPNISLLLFMGLVSIFAVRRRI